MSCNAKGLYLTSNASACRHVVLTRVHPTCLPRPAPCRPQQERKALVAELGQELEGLQAQLQTVQLQAGEAGAEAPGS